MTKTSDHLPGRYLRAFVAAVGIVAALVGVVTWISGWHHGHSLITLGLLVVFVFDHDWRVVPRRGWAVGHVLQANKSIARSDPEEAEKYAATAARHFRRIAAHRRDESWRLASTLDQRWKLLSQLGRHEDALKVAREAAETWRTAVALDGARTRQLAQALNRLAVTLGRLDREAEAIPFTEEAITINRRLVTQYDGQLALSLSNLVVSLTGGEEWGRALPAAEEAWEIHRRLAVADPKLRDEAAKDADQLRRVLRRLDRPDEILHVSETMVNHERALVADDPDRLPEYAEAVRKLGDRLVAVDRVPEAKARWYEALELLRRFSEDNPDGRYSYATVCEEVGHSLGMLRADEETLAVIRDGLAVRRTLAGEDDRHHQELVRALTSAALRLNYSEQPELARQFAAEGLALYREKPEASGPPQVLQVLQVHAGEEPRSGQHAP